MKRCKLLECLDPTCRNILDEGRKWCIAPCMSEEFQRLCLTPIEAIERVWPDIGKIWSGQITTDDLKEFQQELRQRLVPA